MYSKNYVTDRSSSSSFMSKVYGVMAAALSITGVVAYAVAFVPELTTLFLMNKFMFYGLVIGQLLLVIGLSAAITRLSFPAALAGLGLYSVMVGLTTSVIFHVYTMESIGSIFLVAALTFAGMAIFGHFVARDLSGFGTFLSMALWGLIISSVVNLFTKSPAASYWISVFGVLLFAGLTAYDANKIKQLSHSVGDDRELAKRVIIIGALMLYLDFLNLFLHLLQLSGQRKR